MHAALPLAQLAALADGNGLRLTAPYHSSAVHAAGGRAWLCASFSTALRGAAHLLLQQALMEPLIWLATCCTSVCRQERKEWPVGECLHGQAGPAVRLQPAAKSLPLCACSHLCLLPRRPLPHPPAQTSPPHLALDPPPPPHLHPPAQPPHSHPSGPRLRHPPSPACRPCQSALRASRRSCQRAVR